MMTKNLKNISRGMNLKFVIGVLIKGKTMKKYIFDVPCFYVYEVEAETEDKAREILVEDGGLQLEGNLSLESNDYLDAKLNTVEEINEQTI